MVKIMSVVIENFLYLLVLLNPASKIMFLAGYQPQLNRKQTFELAWKSSAAALLILLVIALAGSFMLQKVFHVELYSLQIVGGLVVLVIGWTAIREGRFVAEKLHQHNFTEISLVPLAAPLIAGPGMIAAVIAGCVQFNVAVMSAALAMAIFVNFLLMIFAPAINRALCAVHLAGPLIRLTGLIIACTAMQMILSGIRTFLAVIRLGAVA